ncbi:PREDICTED: 2-aminoethanethiol dioxygenase-like [Branchiostoma belcheri]|uniref:2-aminoethanethiol dioxygenase-like n=1 Tax=Branchiostoma belcheri TaxID=7741 RepID=A0A6P4YPU1_BRABE|nr:PREDICTED: 2-aminoethanethiol dioxygenase-like [Branchiostoma belcheri]
MAALVEKIAKQALLTFDFASPHWERSLKDNFGKLTSFMNQLTYRDVNIEPRTEEKQPRRSLRGRPVSSQDDPAPVTYMPICNHEFFTMGIFLVKGGERIPLHDHPDMHGVCKVLYGTVSIRSYNRLDPSANGTQPPPPLPDFDTPLPPWQRNSLVACTANGQLQLDENSEACVLEPLRGNLHEIVAVDGPAAFLDVLAPPYDHDGSTDRDCHYYRPVTPVKDPAQLQEDDVHWLMRISQPRDFWCDAEPYPGPSVSV